MTHKLLCLTAMASLALLCGAAQAEIQTIEITKVNCDLLVKHIPDADVAYQPGVDSYGRPVAPADLNPSPITHLEDKISIRLTNNAAKLFNLKVPQADVQNGDGTTSKQNLVNTQMEVGYVTLHDGKAYLDGQPLESNQQDELAVLCLHQGR